MADQSISYNYKGMNQIVINNQQAMETKASTIFLSYEEANNWLPVLRSDYFKKITLTNSSQIQAKSLKFLIQLRRLLKFDGQVVLAGDDSKELGALLLKLSLHQGERNAEGSHFLKTKPQPNGEMKKEKLAIGFKSNESEELIDETELMKEENLQIGKKKEQKCQTKPRACANCNCGRKDAQKAVSKEELVKNINEGQPISGCGKCLLGDSFRCGTCPYKGLPAFKPGDKLKLVQEGGVIVEQAATVVSATGKVKLEL